MRRLNASITIKIFFMILEKLNEQIAQNKYKFLQENFEKILEKRLEHRNEYGYVQVFTNCDCELESLEFKSKKSFKAGRFERLDEVDQSDNYVLTGKLYFKVICKESDRSSKFYCDFDLTEEHHSDVNLLLEAIRRMIHEEKKGMNYYEISEYQRYFKPIEGIDEDHPFGKEKAFVLASILIIQIVAIKLIWSEKNDSQWLYEADRDDPDQLMEWMNEYDPDFDEDDDEL